VLVCLRTSLADTTGDGDYGFSLAVYTESRRSPIPRGVCSGGCAGGPHEDHPILAL